MDKSFFNMALALALAATLAALVFGLFTLFKGGDFNRKYGNKAMRWRIILQAIALLIFMIILAIGR